jgi:hypothetical protein
LIAVHNAYKRLPVVFVDEGEELTSLAAVEGFHDWGVEEN